MLTGFLRSLKRSLTISLVILSLGPIGGALGVTTPESTITLNVMESTYAVGENQATATIDGQAITSNTVLKTEGNIATEILKGLNALMAFISVLYVPFSLLAGWLLSSEWTYGDVIGMRPVFHNLWVFVSNFVYVAFAGMLVFVAIANIFGQSDSYAIKKMLPRFIIGVIMVPLTWFGVSATLSIASYATAIVLRLPADTITSRSVEATANNEIRIQYPNNCTLNLQANNNEQLIDCPKGDMGSGSLSEILTLSNGAFGIIPYYAYSIFEFHQIDQFEKQITSAEAASERPEGAEVNNVALLISSIGSITIQFAMKIVFVIVFMVILIMLVFILLIRMIHIWFYIIFSPLFALRFFLSDKVDKDSALSKFSFKEFIGLAMVPVMVSAALGFGLMFLAVFKQQTETKTLNSEMIKTEGEGSTSTLKLFNTTTFTIKTDSMEGAKDAAQNASTILAGFLSDLLTPILGIIVLWLAVMAASKGPQATQKAVEGFESAGKMVGDVAKKVPGMVPIPGSGAFTRNKQPISFNQATRIPNIIKEISDAKHNAEYQEVRAAFGLSDKIDDLTKSINGLSQPLDALKQMATAQQGKSVGEQAASYNNRQNIKATAKQLRISISDIQADLDSGTEAGYLKFWEAFAKKLQTDPNFGRLTPDQQRTISAVATRASTINIANAQTALAGGAQSKNGILNQTGQSFDTSTNKLKFSYKKDQNDSDNAMDIDIPPGATDSQIKTLIESQVGELPDVEIQKLVKVVTNARSTGTPTSQPPLPGNP